MSHSSLYDLLCQAEAGIIYISSPSYDSPVCLVNPLTEAIIWALPNPPMVEQPSRLLRTSASMRACTDGHRWFPRSCRATSSAKYLLFVEPPWRQSRKHILPILGAQTKTKTRQMEIAHCHSWHLFRTTQKETFRLGNNVCLLRIRNSVATLCFV